MPMELMTFRSEEFGTIRTAEIAGEPWFCLADICKPLGLQAKECKRRLNENGVATNHIVDSAGRKNTALFVNEANLYRVIFQSRKPEAERFTDWVTEEVLPSIRKTGTYQTKPVLTPAQLLAQQAQLLVQLEQRTTAMEQKVERALVAMAGPSGDHWIDDMKEAIHRYREATGLTDARARGFLYEALEREANCNTDARLRCLRERKRKAGETRKAYMALTKLDAIAVDKRLRIAFEGVVMRMTAQAELKKTGGENQQRRDGDL